jgi:hypothetical protein
MFYRKLLFEVTIETDPFYEDNNIAHLRRGVAALNAGKGVEHDILEAPERNCYGGDVEPRRLRCYTESKAKE